MENAIIDVKFYFDGNGFIKGIYFVACASIKPGEMMLLLINLNSSTLNWHQFI